jgi:hypothetical protein
VQTPDARLKFHTEALVKEIGVEAACQLTGRSKATLGRYYSQHAEHADRFIPVDAVAALEAKAHFPHVTAALAEMAGLDVARRFSSDVPGAQGDPQKLLHEDMAALSHRFAMLLQTYAEAMANGTVRPMELRRLLTETVELQRVLIDMKLHLERA